MDAQDGREIELERNNERHAPKKYFRFTTFNNTSWHLHKPNLATKMRWLARNLNAGKYDRQRTFIFT